MKKFTLFLSAICLLSFPIVLQSQCTASFVYSLGANGNVTFSSTSTGTTSTTLFTWYLGGTAGVPSASGTAGWTAATQYTVNGTYVVQLAIGGTATSCYSTAQQTITVTTSTNNCALSANYMATTTNSTSVYRFKSISNGTVSGTTYSWDFGDGNTGTGANVLHTYTSTGFFNVKMIANNNFVPTCTASITQPVNFCATMSTTISPSYGSSGQVTLLSPSTGTTSATVYTWNVNSVQGNWQSNLANPTFTLPNGYHQIIYFAKTNSSSSCYAAAQDSIFVSNSAPCILTANFSYIGNGNSWSFLNNTQNTNFYTTYMWDFGDGNTSMQFSPAHTYTVPGVYTVSLTATSGGQVCVSTFTAQISTSCVANAGFSLAPTNTAQVWNAIPASTANISSAIWAWGDGSNSTTLFTSHQYSAAGMYSICLSVSVACGASDAACASYSVYRTRDAAQVVYVNVVPQAGVISGLNKDESAELFVYPNPVKGNFDIRIDGLTDPKARVFVYDITGKVINNVELQREKDSPGIRVKIEQAAAGVYTMKVETDGKVLTRKIIVEK
jgi:PKD repeat protein